MSISQPIIEKTMTENEALTWAITLRRAKMGDKESKKMLKVENKMRLLKNQPRLEEELKAILEKK